jgi:hypothetical protein
LLSAALCSLPSALCPLLSALCPLLSALYPLQRKLFRNDIVLDIYTNSKNTHMKTQKFFTIILIALVLIASCKEEEKGTPRQITKEYTYNENIRGSMGVIGELPLPDLDLYDIIDADVADNLTNAELQLADSYLEISGLNQIVSPDTSAVVLEDFTIKVGTRQGVNLGDVTTNPQGTNDFASDVQHSTNEVVNLIQNIFSDVTSPGKKARISVSFTPNTDITASDNVQLIIHFGGRYFYLERE